MMGMEINCTQCGNKAAEWTPFCSICGYPLIAPVPPKMPVPDCIISGIVVELCKRGFVLQSDNGHRHLVTTMSNGRRLSLKLGDRVHVFGGPGRNRDFASGSIWQILPDGKEIRIKDDPLKSNAATYLIYRLIRLKGNILRKITGMKESETQG